MKQLFKNLALISIIGCGLTPLAYFVHVQYGAAQDKSADTMIAIQSPDSLKAPDETDRYVENLAFGVGEKLYFNINYGFVNAGTATMEVADLIDYNDHPAFQIVSTAKSNNFFSTFYPVRDRVESIFDAVGLFSWRFEKVLREGSYRQNLKYEFDQMNHKVAYKDDTLDIASYCQDALSVLYYVRTQKLEPGKSIFVDNFTDGKNYPLEVKVLRREKVKVEAGDFDCLVVEPLLRSSGIFKHEGRLTVWLTDDRLRMPVQMKSKVVVGSITAELTGYELGRLEEF